MEGFSVKSVAATTIPSFSCRGGFIDKPGGYVLQALEFPSPKRLQLSWKLKFLPSRVQATGTTKSSLEPVGVTSNKATAMDENLVFVAGSTGRVGSRTVRELLKLGFHVRAGVRSSQKADSLVQSVKKMKLDSESGGDGKLPSEKLEIVECDLEKPEQIPSALGNASIVICCIGASEKEIFDITGPCRIDYRATKNLIDAATAAKVNHFILLTSLGTNKFGLPAALLNLFWGVLIWKRKAEEALITSGLPYTIVRPGGMERPTDAFKETHNITLSTEDSLFGGLVSNLQVAELMAVMARNRDLSCCKVVEVTAETTAPLVPMEELLANIPSQRPCIQTLEVPISPPAVEAVPSTGDVEVPSTTTKEKPDPPKAAANQPLSPYTAYEDLKPPTSPSPSQPVTSSTTLGYAPLQLGGSPTEKAIPLANHPENSNHYHSPYHAYADFKPPTSPSPGAPAASFSKSNVDGSTLSTMSGNGTTQTVPDTADGQNQAAANSTVHSPYTMYEDMKPPTSPTPSKS